MRAKMQVNEVGQNLHEGVVSSLQLKMSPVTSKPFDANGKNEDNTYSKWTPSGNLELWITNPALFETFRPGQRFYVDFIEAADGEGGG